MAVGAVSRLRPEVISYLAERCNKPTAQFLANLGFRHFLDTFPTELERMKTFIPLGLFIIGLGFLVFGIQNL